MERGEHDFRLHKFCGAKVLLQKNKKRGQLQIFHIVSRGRFSDPLSHLM